MPFITENDVRHYVQDISWEDNTLLMELAHTPEQIEQAMKSVAREYNSIPPFVHSVRYDRLPDDTNVFLDGIVAALLRTKWLQLSRNDLDHTAGNVTASVDALQIRHFKEQIEAFHNRFFTAAKQIKIFQNQLGFFGNVG